MTTNKYPNIYPNKYPWGKMNNISKLLNDNVMYKICDFLIFDKKKTLDTNLMYHYFSKKYPLHMGVREFMAISRKVDIPNEGDEEMIHYYSMKNYWKNILNLCFDKCSILEVFDRDRIYNYIREIIISNNTTINFSLNPNKLKEFVGETIKSYLKLTKELTKKAIEKRERFNLKKNEIKNWNKYKSFLYENITKSYNLFVTEVFINVVNYIVNEYRTNKSKLRKITLDSYNWKIANVSRHGK